jgi:hypothetical protein
MLSLLCIGLKISIERLENKVSFYWGKLMGVIPSLVRDELFRFEGLRLRLLIRMLEERASSAMKMVTNVFLKQMRRLNYDLFYKDENLKNRRITALIYELTEKQYKKSESDEKREDVKYEEIPDPSKRIFKAAETAFKMGTTFWFTDDDKKKERLKNLVACGQFTACYTLLKYCV